MQDDRDAEAGGRSIHPPKLPRRIYPARTELRHERGRAEEDTVPPNPHAIQVEKRLEVERSRDPAPKSPQSSVKFALNLPGIGERF